MSESERMKRKGTTLLFLSFLLVFSIGYSLLLFSGLSTTAGEKSFFDHTQFADHVENNTRTAELYIDLSFLYLHHGEVVVDEDVRWNFRGEIRLLDGSESQPGTFRFYYHNTSTGYQSHPAYFEYRGSDETNRFEVAFDMNTRFYRPGDYVLHVEDLRPDSNINMTGYVRVVVYDATFKLVEQLNDTTWAAFWFMLSIALATNLIFIWGQMDFGVVLEDVRRELKGFSASGYVDVFMFFFLTFVFDLITTGVGLYHGAWESTEFYRLDMLGGVLFTVLLFVGVGFGMFYLRDKWTFEFRGYSLSIFFLMYSAGFGVGSIMRLFVVANNLDVIRKVAGDNWMVNTLAIIVGLTVVLVVLTSLRVLRRKRNSLRNLSAEGT